MDYLATYAIFLAKMITVVIAALVMLVGLMAIGSKDKNRGKGKLVVKCLNNRYQEYAKTVLDCLKDKDKLRQFKNTNKKNNKDKPKNRIFVLDFNGDIRGNQVNALREEISALLLVADSQQDEVLVRLESGGGVVNAYGLAASQLCRIRKSGIKVTVAVDKIAASGGYMMACIADHIIAAPFAVVGSIGVIAQLPNFHDFLRHNHINFEQVTAGKYKRTLTVFGENTDKGREKMQQEVNDTLELFKEHINKFRPQVDIARVATGEHWFAKKAITLHLVDGLGTSDDFILDKIKKARIYKIEYKQKKSLPQKLANGMTILWQKLYRNRAGQDYI